ncbi:MAG TPA: hypothetical protein VE173_06215, partial [Longimicrobiales bacterium]|nr:hypothetical protein [Longimicrobiales bacterium]
MKLAGSQQIKGNNYLGQGLKIARFLLALLAGVVMLMGVIMAQEAAAGPLIISRVSTSSAGVEATGGGSLDMAVSADGRYVVFESDATNLVPGDTNTVRDIFVKDTQTGTTTRVSTTSASAPADGSSFDPAISADGRYVAFESDATNLVPGDTNAFSDVFVKDTQTGATTRVSTTSAGAEANGGSF